MTANALAAGPNITQRQFDQEVNSTTVSEHEKLYTEAFYGRLTNHRNLDTFVYQSGNALIVDTYGPQYYTAFEVTPYSGNPGGLTRSYATLDNEIYSYGPDYYTDTATVNDVARSELHLGVGATAYEIYQGVTNTYGVEVDTYNYARGLDTFLAVSPY